MIAKPKANCPRCRSRYTVYDATWVGPHADTVEYYAECDCGAATLAVSKGQVTGITPCDPVDTPDSDGTPPGDQEDPGYMAI